MSDTLVNDIDPIETQDWLSAVDSLIRAEGRRACALHHQSGD